MAPSPRLSRVLVTGGAGFIGNAVVRRLLARVDARILNVDLLTYASAPEALAEWEGTERYQHCRTDVGDRDGMERAFATFAPEAVIHLAAETHVDRSIDMPRTFLDTNVVGTCVLLEVATAYWQSLAPAARERFRLLHVSTDEVFGALASGDPPFTPSTPYCPRSPYAASKAAADHYVRAWRETFGLPTIVTSCSNNFGPWQFPEKFIPVVVLRAASGQPVPIYGRGDQIRDWLHVDDHANGLIAALEQGEPGATYLFGGRNEQTNLELARRLCDLVDELMPDAAAPRRRLLTSVEDRPGHDARYAIDPSLAEQELGWRPGRAFGGALRETVVWYLDHAGWVDAQLRRMGGYRRLGLGATR